jgi:hypothetical protein
MRHWRAMVAGVLLIAMAMRLVPGLSIGLPYGFDVFDLMSRVVPTLGTGKFTADLPQGPLLYALISELTVLNGAGLEATASYIAPAILAFSVIPAIIYTKKAVNDEAAAIVAGLLAASSNVIVHQTGGTVVWEGLGTIFAGYALTSLIRPNFRSPKAMALLGMSMAGLLLSHHLTTMNVLLGLGVAALFSMLLAIRGDIGAKEAYRTALVAALLGAAALLIWMFVIPRSTIEVIDLTAATMSIWTLVAGGLIATTLIAASYHVIAVRSAGHFWNTRPFALALVVFFASAAVPLLLFLSGGMSAEVLRMVLYLGVPLCVVYVPLFVIGLAVVVKGQIDSHALVFLLAFPTACASIAIFLILQPGLGVLAYREVSFMLYSLLPIEGIGLMEIVRRGTPARRYVMAFIVAYSILALASTSYPSSNYLIGLNETYRPSDLRASQIIVNVVPSTASIDTDVRMGNLILYFSGRDIDWVSNVTYWNSPGPAWLGKSAMAGHPLDIPPNISFIVLSETMLKSNGGIVVDLLSRRLYPLPDEALTYLERRPGVSKVADAGTALLFQVIGRQDGGAPQRVRP